MISHGESGTLAPDGAFGAHDNGSFVRDVRSFTRAFSANGHNSNRLIRDFVWLMARYGIYVKVKKK